MRAINIYPVWSFINVDHSSKTLAYKEKYRYFQAMLYENLEVTSQDLPDLTELEFKKHPKRYLKLRLFSLFVMALLFSGIALSMWFAENINAFIILGSIWVVLFSWATFAEIKSFPLRGYLVRQKDISYRKGWIFQSVVTVPYNRIQHSEVSQGPIARILKLSTLKIFTAGGSASDLAIHGLEPEEADRLREWLSEKTAAHV